MVRWADFRAKSGGLQRSSWPGSGVICERGALPGTVIPAARPPDVIPAKPVPAEAGSGNPPLAGFALRFW